MNDQIFSESEVRAQWLEESFDQLNSAIDAWEARVARISREKDEVLSRFSARLDTNEQAIANLTDIDEQRSVEYDNVGLIRAGIRVLPVDMQSPDGQHQLRNKMLLNTRLNAWYLSPIGFIKGPGISWAASNDKSLRKLQDDVGAWVDFQDALFKFQFEINGRKEKGEGPSEHIEVAQTNLDDKRVQEREVGRQLLHRVQHFTYATHPVVATQERLATTQLQSTLLTWINRSFFALNRDPD